MSEEPLQLQAQVRELKGQLENQSKLILQMQSLLRRNSLSSISPAASICDPFTTREPEGTFKVDRGQEGKCKGGQPKEKEGEAQSKDKSRLPGKELDRSVSELQQARSRSTSPARSAIQKTVFEVLIKLNNMLPFFSFCLSFSAGWILLSSHKPESCPSSGSRSRRAAGSELCIASSWKS